MFNGIAGIAQAGFVVNDLDAAVERWFQRGAGPFRAFRDLEIELTYRSQPSQLKLSLALGQFDGVQIELIHILDDRPSLFSECYPGGYPEESLHHIGMIADDYDAFVQKHAEERRPLVMNGEFSGYRFGFVDTRAPLGFMLEAFERTPSFTAFFSEIEALGATWDGTNAFG